MQGTTEKKSKKGDQQREKIAEAVSILFIKHGLQKTTYSALSEHTGIPRQLVQYYYPMKNLLVLRYIKKLIDSITQVLRASDLEQKNLYISLYELSQCYYAFLLQDENHRALFKEILRDRELTDEIHVGSAIWGMSYLFLSDNDEVGKAIEINLLRTGGLYDYLYHCMKVDEEPKLADLVEEIITELLTSIGQSEPEQTLNPKDYIISSKMMRELISKLDILMYGGEYEFQADACQYKSLFA